MQARDVSWHRRLSFRLAVAAALTSALGLAAVTLVLVRQERANLTEQLTLRTLSEARNLALAASAPLLRHDPELGLHPLILRALDEVSDLEELVVVDSNRRIVGHRDLLRVGETVHDFAGDPVEVRGLRLGESARATDASILLRVPIRHLDEEVGWLIATVSGNGINLAVRGAVVQALMVSAIGVLMVTLFIVFLVARSLSPMAALRASVQRIGAGDLSQSTQVESDDELGMLAALIDDMAAGLAQAQVERLQKERIDHELGIAHDLQTMLLPERIPSPAGYTLAAHYEPALEVSGDYYDIVQLGDERYAVIVADVSGKGVPGLVVMAMLRTLARQIALSGADPRHLLVEANDNLRSSIPRGMFITCVCGILDTRQHSFDYANAGHCPPVLYGSSVDGARSMPVGGKALGMFPSSVLKKSLQLHRVEIPAGAGLLVYSDGLTEAMDDSRSQLGEDAVLHALSTATADAPTTLESLRELVSKHQGKASAPDDLTLFLFARESSPSPVDAQVHSVEEIFQ